MFPPAYVPSYKHTYNSNLEEYLNDVIVNSLSIYMDREDFIDSVDDTDENIKIADTLIPYFYENGCIVINQKYINIEEKKIFMDKLNFSSLDLIQNVVSDFLNERGNIFILYTITYIKSKREYNVMGKYLSNASRYNEQFISDYIKTKRVYLINKLLENTNNDTD